MIVGGSKNAHCRCHAWENLGEMNVHKLDVGERGEKQKFGQGRMVLHHDIM
jgi:hypothetical protein